MLKRPLTPAQFLAFSFSAFIAIGTLLLKLPFAVEPDQTISWIDALYTSTSAVCVTGLITVDTPRVFSTFGEVVIALLVQAGGLGYMTISTVLGVMVGRRMSLQERVLLQESLNVYGREGIVPFARTVATFTLAVELAGAFILTLYWWPSLGLGQATYLAAFHAISAFNNAGFSLFSDNLLRFRSDWVVNLVIALLIIAGGVGFLVLKELLALVRRPAHYGARPKLTHHTRLVLVMTGLLLLVGTAAIFVFEASNSRTLAGVGTADALLASFFQSVSARTAGFNTIDIGAMRPVTLFVLMVLMFIGASPGGTGGGVKTTTFGITVAALWATIRGHRDAVIMRRRISSDTVARSFFISLIAFLALNVVAGLLLAFEGRDLLATLFETTSAFGTVGLSMGQSGSVLSLSAFFGTTGKLLVATMMFMGRVGPLTLAIAVVGRRSQAPIRYPEARVAIG